MKFCILDICSPCQICKKSKKIEKKIERSPKRKIRQEINKMNTVPAEIEAAVTTFYFLESEVSIRARY